MGTANALIVPTFHQMEITSACPRTDSGCSSASPLLVDTQSEDLVFPHLKQEAITYFLQFENASCKL